MADENNTSFNADATATNATATATEPKKQRAPRRPKIATDMMGGLTVAKQPRGRRKRNASAEDATLTSSDTPTVGKRRAKGVIKEDGRKTRTKSAVQAATAPVAAIDELADLIHLEEENKRLRKSLADKLRTENADLRKRLGLD